MVDPPLLVPIAADAADRTRRAAPKDISVSCNSMGNGQWTSEEDKLLVDYIQANGIGKWRTVARLAGLDRSAKSCRLRWTNYLLPGIKCGPLNVRSNSTGIKKMAWSPEEDKLLVDYIQANGIGKWRTVAKFAGLNRCSKSCRFRWTNYLRPGIKRGPFTPEEQNSLVQLHAIFGNKWSAIARRFPGRTDNEIKNYWRTFMKKQLRKDALHATIADPVGGGPPSGHEYATASFNHTVRHMTQWESVRREAEERFTMFSSSATTTVTSTPVSSSSTVPSADHAAPDILVRLCNAEVGNSPREATDIQQNGLHGPETSSAAAGGVLTANALPAAELGGDILFSASNGGTEVAVYDDYRAFLGLARDGFTVLHGDDDFSVFLQPDLFGDVPCGLFAPFE